MFHIKKLAVNDSANDHNRLLTAIALSVAAITFAGCDRSEANESAKIGKKNAAVAPTADSDKHGHSGGDEHDEHADEDGGHVHGEEADEVKLTAEAVKRTGIRLGIAKLQSLTAAITAPARVAYNEEAVAHVGSLISGRIIELPVRIGEIVKKGDIVAVIDSAELGAAQSDYLQDRTAAETARPAVELAKSAYDRAQQLYDQTQGISLTDVQTRQREYRTVQGELAAAEAGLLAATNRLQLLGMDEKSIKSLAESGTLDPTYHVRAPIAGRMIEREVTLGELVGPDKERLLMLADLSTVWVLADVPEAELGQIKEGAAVQINLTAAAGETFEGKVAHISPELDAATRSVRVRVEVSNADSKLRPGMFARAEIAAGTTNDEKVLAVLEGAIQNVEGEPAVFVPVEGEPNTFAKRAVGVGPAIGGLVPIFAGLKDGEKYVSIGSFVLKAELGKAGAAHEH